MTRAHCKKICFVTTTSIFFFFFLTFSGAFNQNRLFAPKTLKRKKQNKQNNIKLGITKTLNIIQYGWGETWIYVNLLNHNLISGMLSLYETNDWINPQT